MNHRHYRGYLITHRVSVLEVSVYNDGVDRSAHKAKAKQQAAQAHLGVDMQWWCHNISMECRMSEWVVNLGTVQDRPA